MKKQNVYLLAGIAWLACGIYQLKNHNMFMVIASAVISLLCFVLAFYKIEKKSNGSDKSEAGS